MNFHEAVEAAGVPEGARKAFQVDAHRVWLAAPLPYEAPAVRAVFLGLLEPEQIEAADRLGGPDAVRGLLESVGALSGWLV